MDKTLTEVEKEVDQATADYLTAQKALATAQDDYQKAAQRLDKAQKEFNAYVVEKAKISPKESYWGKALLKVESTPSIYNSIPEAPPRLFSRARENGMSAVDEATKP